MAFKYQHRVHPTHHHSQPDLLVRIDDKDRADSERDARLAHILFTDHIVKPGDLSLGIGNNRELQIGVSNIVDILDPTFMRTKIIGALNPCQRCRRSLTRGGYPVPSQSS